MEYENDDAEADDDEEAGLIKDRRSMILKCMMKTMMMILKCMMKL